MTPPSFVTPAPLRRLYEEIGTMNAHRTGFETAGASRRKRLVSLGLSVSSSAVAILLAAAAAFSLGVALLPAFGYHATVISGGSMEPAVRTGALVISRAAPPDSLQVGDVITFRRPEAQASMTHRIVAEHNVDGKLAFTTKGDANPTPDATDISLSADTERMTFNAPYAGYAVAFLHSPGGMLFLIASPMIGLAALSILGMGRGRLRAEAHQG